MSAHTFYIKYRILTWVTQTQDKDGFYGRNVCTDGDNGIYHLGQHHLTCAGILVLSIQSCACKHLIKGVINS